jgi:hypothetical protein
MQPFFECGISFLVPCDFGIGLNLNGGDNLANVLGSGEITGVYVFVVFEDDVRQCVFLDCVRYHTIYYYYSMSIYININILIVVIGVSL